MLAGKLCKLKDVLFLECRSVNLLVVDQVVLKAAGDLKQQRLTAQEHNHNIAWF